MHGIGWSAARRWLAFCVFVLLLVVLRVDDVGNAMLEASRIPLIYFLAVPLLALGIRVFLRSETSR